MNITPSQALARLSDFSKRVDRLEANQYSNPRFRVADLNRLKASQRGFIFLCSIGVHNRNKERATEIISVAKEKFSLAKEKYFYGNVC